MTLILNHTQQRNHIQDKNAQHYDNQSIDTLYNDTRHNETA